MSMRRREKPVPEQEEVTLEEALTPYREHAMVCAEFHTTLTKSGVDEESARYYTGEFLTRYLDAIYQVQVRTAEGGLGELNDCEDDFTVDTTEKKGSSDEATGVSD